MSALDNTLTTILHSVFDMPVHHALSLRLITWDNFPTPYSGARAWPIGSSQTWRSLTLNPLVL